MSEARPASDVLSQSRYEALLESAETYREALVVRLVGEVGLRPAEITRLRPDCVERERSDPARYLLAVPAADGDDVDRSAYLPSDLERELRRYVRSNAIGDDEPIVTVTARRLQMLVSEVAERASEARNDPALAAVSSNDLRRYFARTALVERDIDPRIVKAAGGWRSFEGLEPYLSEPTDERIVDAFEAIERPSSDADRPSASDESVVRSLLAATDRCALVRLDEDGYVERWNRSAATTFGYQVGEIVGTHVSAFYTDEAVDRGVPDRTLAAAMESASVDVEGWRIGADGTRFWATEVVASLHDEGGTHDGFAVLVCDVTDLREHLESRRDRQRELRRALDVARRHRAVTRAVLDAESHADIETAVCDALVEGEPYAFAWIDRRSVAADRREPLAARGVEGETVDRLASALGSPTGAGRRDASRGAIDRADVPELSIEREVEVSLPTGQFSGAIAAVPIACGDTVYGTLGIGSDRPDAFAGDERDWLETIGASVGHAIAAVRRRNLLLSDAVVELELRCRDDRSFFVDCAARLDCRFELDSLVPVTESTYLYYVHLEGASPADVFALADDDPGIEDCRLVETDETGWRAEFVVTGSSPTLTLTEYGASVREMVVEDRQARIVAECAGDADLRTIVDGLRSAFPDFELLGKRAVDRAVRTDREFRSGLENRLTDRQDSALRAAYFGGYYDWPRESTAEEIADAMGVSSPTLHNHLRKGQHELLRTFFDEPSGE